MELAFRSCDLPLLAGGAGSDGGSIARPPGKRQAGDCRLLAKVLQLAHSHPNDSAAAAAARTDKPAAWARRTYGAWLPPYFLLSSANKTGLSSISVFNMVACPSCPQSLALLKHPEAVHASAMVNHPFFLSRQVTFNDLEICTGQTISK